MGSNPTRPANLMGECRRRDYIFEKCPVAHDLTCRPFSSCGGYSLDGKAPVCATGEREFESLWLPSILSGALGKHGLSRLILDQDIAGSNPVRAAKSPEGTVAER